MQPLKNCQVGGCFVEAVIQSVKLAVALESNKFVQKKKKSCKQALANIKHKQPSDKVRTATYKHRKNKNKPQKTKNQVLDFEP
jgi:hypothetical protein